MSQPHQYHLYQTFLGNIPTKDLTKKQKEVVQGKIKDLDEKQIETMIMLITEDARLNNNYKPLFSNVELPYGGFQNEEKDGNTNIEFDLEKFPIRLKWVLLKFIGMVDGKVY